MMFKQWLAFSVLVFLSGCGSSGSDAPEQPSEPPSEEEKYAKFEANLMNLYGLEQGTIETFCSPDYVDCTVYKNVNLITFKSVNYTTTCSMGVGSLYPELSEVIWDIDNATMTVTYREDYGQCAGSAKITQYYPQQRGSYIGWSANKVEIEDAAIIQEEPKSGYDLSLESTFTLSSSTISQGEMLSVLTKYCDDPTFCGEISSIPFSLDTIFADFEDGQSSVEISDFSYTIDLSDYEPTKAFIEKTWL